MKFFDLNEQNNSIKEEIKTAIESVVESGRFISGPQVEGLENEMAEFCGSKYAVAVNSGTDALFLSLKALGIGEGDTVITSPFTFFATAEAIANLSAKPVFADIDPKTFNISASEIKAKITPATKAIIPVHLFGQAADMDEIMALAKEHNLKVVEDAAQAIGAEYQGKRAGSFGNCGCFSFFPTKNLGAFGDAGIITTNNKDIADKLKTLRAHGSSLEDKYCNLILGVNSRLDALQAAVLRVKLKHLQKWNKSRQENAQVYTEAANNIEQIQAPVITENRTHIFHQYTVRAQKRDELKDFLKENDMPTMVYYSLPLHLQPAFEYLGYKQGDFPEAEKAALEVLSLPIYPELKNSELEKLIEKIKQFYAN